MLWQISDLIQISLDKDKYNKLYIIYFYTLNRHAVGPRISKKLLGAQEYLKGLFFKDKNKEKMFERFIMTIASSVDFQFL